jgi:hypothetical protein
MAKFKPPRSRRNTTTARSNRALIPCAILVIGGFVLIFLLLYEVMKSGK